MQHLIIAGVPTFLCGGPDGNGGGDGPLVCFLHGYGGGAELIMPIVPALGLPPEVRYAFPEGPVLVPGFPPPGRAWFPLDIDRISRDLQPGGPSEDLLHFLAEDPPGMGKARLSLKRWLAALQRQLGALPHRRIAVGGFSQGAIVAVDLALGLPEIAGLFVLSGAVLNGRRWEQLAEERAARGERVPRFQAHGAFDRVIPWQVGQALAQLLEPAFPGPFVRFETGGHEIPPDIARILGGYLFEWFA